jgi:hypothetical protein
VGPTRGSMIKPATEGRVHFPMDPARPVRRPFEVCSARRRQDAQDVHDAPTADANRTRKFVSCQPMNRRSNAFDQNTRTCRPCGSQRGRSSVCQVSKHRCADECSTISCERNSSISARRCVRTMHASACGTSADGQVKQVSLASPRLHPTHLIASSRGTQASRTDSLSLATVVAA